MRTPFTHSAVGYLKYQIREVVDVAQKLAELNPDFKFVGENIGDPITKAWTAPPFLKEELLKEIKKPGDAVFGYSHSRGNPNVRKWIVEHIHQLCPTSHLDYENILFTSGLGAAIALLYQMLPKNTRVIQPTPAYPTHTSMESFSAEAEPIFYELDPDNGWEPNIEQLESQLKNHPEVGAILVINPNNPTGAVYSRETLEKIVSLAEKYNLMIISDEVYFRMVYNGYSHVHIVELAEGRVPLVVMRGISKDVPWPGGRSGWLEFHNVELDSDYKNYVMAMRQRVMLEVCSTSLPQFVIPAVYDHPDYPVWLQKNNQELEENGNYIAQVLNNTKGLSVNPTNGAFYMMPLFDKGVLNANQSLPIEHGPTKEFIDATLAKTDMPLDQRFTYYLLATTGICVVPASGFYAKHFGFRLTTLDRDDTRRKDTYSRLSQAIEQYIASA